LAGDAGPCQYRSYITTEAQIATEAKKARDGVFAVANGNLCEV
jgi:hypothetical protein